MLKTIEKRQLHGCPNTISASQASRITMTRDYI